MQAQHVQPHLGRDDPVLDERVIDGSVAAGQLDDGVQLPLEGDLLGQGRDAALEAEGAHRNRPAGAGLADHEALLGDGAVEEDLVELGGAGQLQDRPDLDAGLVHRHEQVGEAVVLALPRSRCGR